MANSVNTNRGALIALQNLNATNRSLEMTQNRVNTGMKVSSAKDNGAIFAIATSQRAEMGAQDAVKQSIERGKSIVDVALAAGETVVEALTELKSLAVAIQDSVAGSSSETKLINDFEAIVKEIHTSLAGATFDGVNAFKTGTQIDVTINTAATGNKFTIKASADAAAADGLAFTGTANSATGAWAAPAAAGKRAAYEPADVEAAINSFTTVLADLGTKSKSLDRQLTFVSKLQDSLETGIGNLVDADLAKESARLTALQTKQQLGVQALGIANQASSIVLNLFR
ncbi:MULTISPECIES: flagellin [unclassified Brevundimonas]|uniref:flagellin N-terminal helical domain-containing protein n=1 Tax=unclassified Brevundimonas TaxID=2622653 RepID=UPI0025C1BECE|nr:MULTISPECIES: flagellin [unclassified Brevundimonas]